MKKKVLKIIAVILAFLLFGVLCVYWTFQGQRDALISFANVSLYNLYDVMELLEYLEDKNINDSGLKEKLEIMLATQLIQTRSVKPEISELQGYPLKALCKAIAYKRRNGIGINGLGKYKDDRLAKMASEYLDSIEGDLINHITQMNGFYSKTDCPILP